MVNYIGDYDYYLEKKEELTEKYAPVQEDIKETPSAGAVSESKLTWQQQERRTGAETEKRKRTEKDRTAYRGTGNKRPEIDDTLVLPEVCTDPGRCAELSREKDAIQKELEELYEKWEALA